MAIMSQDWTDDALCAGIDPELFFPAQGGGVGLAKSICHRCDVQIECLEYALANEIEYGVWGGYSTRQRKRMLRQQKKEELCHSSQ